MGFSEYEKEDYGQTFGKWGVGAGCYVGAYQFWGHQLLETLLGSFVNVLGGDPVL